MLFFPGLMFKYEIFELIMTQYLWSDFSRVVFEALYDVFSISYTFTKGTWT